MPGQNALKQIDIFLPFSSHTHIQTYTHIRSFNFIFRLLTTTCKQMSDSSSATPLTSPVPTPSCGGAKKSASRPPSAGGPPQVLPTKRPANMTPGDILALAHLLDTPITNAEVESFREFDWPKTPDYDRFKQLSSLLVEACSRASGQHLALENINFKLEENQQHIRNFCATLMAHHFVGLIVEVKKIFPADNELDRAIDFLQAVFGFNKMDYRFSRLVDLNGLACNLFCDQWLTSLIDGKTKLGDKIIACDRETLDLLPDFDLLRNLTLPAKWDELKRAVLNAKTTSKRATKQSMVKHIQTLVWFHIQQASLCCGLTCAPPSILSIFAKTILQSLFPVGDEESDMNEDGTPRPPLGIDMSDFAEPLTNVFEPTRNSHLPPKVFGAALFVTKMAIISIGEDEETKQALAMVLSTLDMAADAYRYDPNATPPGVGGMQEYNEDDLAAMMNEVEMNEGTPM